MKRAAPQQRQGTGKAGVVLADESGQSLCAWLDQAEALVRGGVRVLAIDPRIGRWATR
jgi:hypothetical protein